MNKNGHRIIGFLKRLRRRRLAGGLAAFLLRILAVLPAYLCAALGFFVLAGFYEASGTVARLALVALLVWTGYHFPWPQVPFRFRTRQEAAWADRQLGNTGRIESAVCFLGEGTVEGLKAEHLACVARELPAKMRTFPGLPRPWRLAGTAGAVLLLLAVFLFPAAAARGRDILLGRVAAGQLPVRLVYPRELAAGAPFTLRIETPARSAGVEFIHDGEQYHRRPEVQREGFTITLGSVTRELRFRVSLRDGSRRHEGPWHAVRVLRPLYISGISFRIRYPEYMRRKEETVDNENIFRLPAGTSLLISGRANLPLARAQLQFTSGPAAGCRVRGRDFSAALTVRGETAFRFRVVTGDGRTNEAPLLYRIRLQQDLPPVVRILDPPREAVAPRTLLVPLVYDLSDDYGIAAAALEYVILHPGREERGRLALPGEGSGGLFRHVWDVNRLPVYPGVTLRYRITATDRQNQRGMSHEHTLRLPTLGELFTRADTEQQEIRRQLEKLVQDRIRAQQRLDDLQKQQDNSGKPDTEARRREAHRLREERGRLEKELKKLEDRLRGQEDRHSGGPLYSPKTLEAIRKVRAALAKLRLDMKQPDLRLDQLAPALAPDKQKDFEARLQKELENFLAALKRMERDRVLDSVRARLGEAEKKVPAGDQRRDPGDRTRDLQEASRLSAQAADALKKLLQDEPLAGLRDDLDKIRDRLDKLTADLQTMAGKQQGGGQDNAAGKKLRDELRTLQRQLAGMTARGRAAMARALLDKLTLITDEVLFLANRLTGLQESWKGLGYGWMQGPGASRDALLQLLSRLAEQERLTRQRLRALEQAVAGLFFQKIPPLALLEGVLKDLDLLRDQLQNRMVAGTTATFNRAGAATAQTVAELLRLHDALQQQQQQGQQGGEPGGGDGMGDLAGQQGKLDKELQEMMRRAAAGQLTAADRQRLGEMAALQRMIREALGRKAGQGGQNPLLGDLQRLRDEMKKVADALAKGRLDTETLRRERKILDRLLQGTRALRRMGENKERKATAGAGLGLEDSGGTLPARLLQIRRLLQQEAARGGGDPEARRLLREYLEYLYREIGGD